MKKFAILANPASHSLSPAMHNAVFAQIEKNTSEKLVYGREEISPENLDNFMNNFTKDSDFRGLSVSVPHKESLIHFFEKNKNICELDESVEYIGAINTIYKNDSGKILATNTDWIGFKNSLEKQYDAHKKKYLVLGAGGASRAIIYALLKCKASQIYIWNRTEKTAEDVVEHFSKISDKIFLAKTEQLPEISLETDCIINTTSVGMTGKLENISPFPKELFQSFHSAFDIVYTPKETIFLKDCKNAGGKSMTGEEMLLLQGVEQNKLFCESAKSDFFEKKGEIYIEKIMKSALKIASRNFKNWIAPKLSENQKQNILQTIVENKEQELFLSREFLYNKKSENNQNKLENKTNKFRFYEKLKSEKVMKNNKSPHVIAEIKPASPSKGQIFLENDSVECIAKLYEENGVSCISVLTDFTFFGATSENLKKANVTTTIPLLRKDFIIDESQIIEAYKLGASTILLMRSVLSAKEIENFINIAKIYELDCLVEVHDEAELRDVLENTSAMIIGVNTRDLKTMKINPENFQDLLEIAKQYPNFSEKVWIAESGISSKNDIEKYASEANAVLIGTGILMSGGNAERKKVLQNLV